MKPSLRLPAGGPPGCRRLTGWIASTLAAGAVVLACTGDEGNGFENSGPTTEGPTGESLILITLDTTRADHLGAYGSTRALTPHLDELAEQAVVFEMALVQAAVTPVSHASILTGRFPYQHGLRVLHGSSENRLAEVEVTLAEILGQGGYSTGAFVSSFPASERFGLHQGFDVFDADFGTDPDRAVSDRGTVSTGRVQRRGDETVDRALAWLDGRTGPYFLWVHFFDPHDPLVLPPRDFIDDFGPMPTDELDVFRELYAREVAFMDREIGRLLGAVNSGKSSNSPLVVVISDHGEGLGDHDWWTHGILYQEQIHAPFLFFDPQRDAVRVPDLVRSVDLVPTVLDRLGIEAPEDLAFGGRSLLPLLDTGTVADPLLGYADSINTLTYSPHPRIRDVKDDVLFTVVEFPWKYIHHLGDPQASELYHLVEDPLELANRLTTEPDRVRAMRRLLGRMDPLPSSLRDGTNDGGEMSEEDRARLEALGYVQ